MEAQTTMNSKSNLEKENQLEESGSLTSDYTAKSKQYVPGPITKIEINRTG